MIRRRRLIVLFGLPLLVSGLWLLGFTWFSHDARRQRRPPDAADAIVVLTGGADRIGTALRLLQEGTAPLLMVSGVPAHVALPDLVRRPAPEPRFPLELWSARITLGHAAVSTAGNADEIGPWARENKVHSLIVVTAGYHMRRALIEIQRALPDAVLYPVPVQPPALRGPDDYGTLTLLANEYDKWIAAWLGLARLLRSES